jgi:hypothetical protein
MGILLVLVKREHHGKPIPQGQVIPRKIKRLFGILRSAKLLYYQVLTQHVDVPTS